MKHGMYGVAEKFLRLQEYPFSSEQKMMAVKCSPKYGEVNIVSNLFDNNIFITNFCLLSIFSIFIY